MKEDKLIRISKSFRNNFDVMIFNFNGNLNVGNVMLERVRVQRSHSQTGESSGLAVSGWSAIRSLA